MEGRWRCRGGGGVRCVSVNEVTDQVSKQVTRAAHRCVNERLWAAIR